MNITTTYTQSELQKALMQAKQETKTGLCDLFITKLERLSAHIRANDMTPHEAAELLDQEIDSIRLRGG